MGDRTLEEKSDRFLARITRLGYPVIGYDYETCVKMDSKLEMHNILHKHPILKTYVPETTQLREEDFRKFVRKNKDVFLKPINSHSGRGIIRLLSRDHKFMVQLKTKRRYFFDLDPFSSYVFSKTRSKPYLIQKRIQLACIDNQPFDIRIIVQRTSENAWLTTGKVARWAPNDTVITSTSMGARRLPLKSALLRCDKEISIHKDKILTDLEHIALLTATVLADYYPFHNIYGVDLGLDSNLNVFIIEVNPWPYLKGFKSFDPLVYRMIRSLLNENSL